MRTTMRLSIAALFLSAGIAACGDGRATDANTQDEFKRDLQLASSTTMDLAAPKVDPALLNSLETEPQGAPQPAPTVKKGAGSRAVRSQTPTVRATPEVDVAAVDETIEEVESVASAPVPEPTNEPVAVAPRPTPVVIQSGGGNGDYGTNGDGGGIFGPGSGGIGVVIRGGGVDGDHCEIHRPGRGRTSRGPVYTTPNTGGIYIGIGSRIPGRTASQPTFPRQTSGRTARGSGFSRPRIR